MTGDTTLTRSIPSRPVSIEQSTMIFKFASVFGLAVLSALSVTVEASVSGDQDKAFLSARPLDDEGNPISFPNPDEKHSLRGLRGGAVNKVQMCHKTGGN
jgi:hypothetical protein